MMLIFRRRYAMMIADAAFISFFRFYFAFATLMPLRDAFFDISTPLMPLFFLPLFDFAAIFFFLFRAAADADAIRCRC